MNRMTDNDYSWGPFTFARWTKTIGILISSGDYEDPENYIRINFFNWALRIQIPEILQPFGKYEEHEVEYGFRISDMGNGYDFLQVMYGPQTHDSRTEKHWTTHFPWKQWRCVRDCIYTPGGDLFATENRGSDRGFREFMELREKCPKIDFWLEDYDQEIIKATCMIEEREWHRGRGDFKWLSRFYPVKISRSLDIKFNKEVGPEKGSWKGGTLGHGIEMIEGETPEKAFRRYCDQDHRSKSGKFRIKYLGQEAPKESSSPA